MEERNTGLVRRAVEEIWNGGDLTVADALFAPDYLNHGGLIPDLVRGPEAIKVSVTLYRTAFPEFHIAVEALVAGSETVELHWAAHASGSRETVLRGMTQSRVVAEQITESWTCWDHAGVLRHLGLVPADEGGTAPVSAPSPAADRKDEHQ